MTKQKFNNKQKVFKLLSARKHRGYWRLEWKRKHRTENTEIRYYDMTSMGAAIEALYVQLFCN